jgi:hypothetical protein
MKRRLSALGLVSSLFLVVLASGFGHARTDAPEHPAQARKEIVKAFEIWGAVSTLEQVEANLYLIDDSRGVLEAARQAQQNFPFEVTHDRYRVTDVSFVNPTTADVTYNIVIEARSEFARQGNAVLKDDGWKLTRDTVCADLSLAGGQCDPPPPETTLTFVPSQAAPPAPVIGVPRFTG